MLAEIERYYDAVPRAASRVEVLGPFTLFVKVGGGWPYYARPTLGARTFSVEDVERVRARQRELVIPEAFEWVRDTSPGVSTAVAATGLHVHEHALMVLDASAAQPALTTDGFVVRTIAEDDDLARIGAVARLAFAAPGAAIGETGIAALADATAPSVESERERLRRGLTVTVAAFTPEGDPVSVGSHQPLNGVSEIVGVGTLPAFRRRGIAAAVTAVLVEDALRRVQTVFLSAGDADAARIYGRLGFRPLATACIAEPA